MYRQLELDTKLFKRTNTILEKALEGKFLIRTELQQLFKEKKIPADGLRLGYIMMYAELEQLICSGPRQGKQFTYALLDERVPAVKKISHEEALAKLADRYFKSRGPVTIQDFAYWSGLTAKDATTAATSLNKDFIREKIDGKEFIFMPPPPKTKLHHDVTFLMPDYDEYGMSYKDRSVIAPKQKLTGSRSGSIVFNRMLVINGRIEGSWQRELNKNINVNLAPFAPLSKAQQQEVEKAVQRFQSFATPSKKSGK